jgi:zinc transport system substrate-binding protein
MPATRPLAWAACAALAALCSVQAAAGDAETRVAVSILPQQWMVQQVAGERVETVVLVEPGANEATYAPSPAKLAALDAARAWFTIGVPFEDAWQDRITRDRPRLELVDLTEGLPRRRIEGGGHDHGPSDPHLWTDPRLAARMALTIGEALARLDAAGAVHYRRAASAVEARLLALHEDIARELAPVAGRTFVVFHPSWGYFADAYGLKQLPIELGGREPGPRSLATVIETAKAADARAVFVQSQFSRRGAQAVAEAIGAKLVEADPLAADYADNLRRVAASMRAALDDETKQ